jgi:hypothetical protein
VVKTLQTRVGIAPPRTTRCGKCLSGPSRGTAGKSPQKNQASELLPRPDPHGARYIRPRRHLSLYYRSNRPCQTAGAICGSGVLVRRRHRATAIKRGSGGRLKTRPQRRAIADRTRNPTKGCCVAKSEFRCLGTKDGTGSAKLPAV